jgi:Putative translation initiation inhibitor, yjgF family
MTLEPNGAQLISPVQELEMTETKLHRNETINPASMAKPSGYAHGMKAGNTVYLGGQTALDKDMNIVPGGIVEQFKQVFSNVLTTLVEAGGHPEDLVSVTIYLTDVDDYMANGREIGRVWREMAGTDTPQWLVSVLLGSGRKRP